MEVNGTVGGLCLEVWSSATKAKAARNQLAGARSRNFRREAFNSGVNWWGWCRLAAGFGRGLAELLTELGVLQKTLCSDLLCKNCMACF